MTTNPSVTTELDAKPGAMTQANCAHLFRSIEHAITYDGLVSPTSVHMQPESGYAMLQFAADDVATVQEWAARTGSTVVHGDHTYKISGLWHEFGTRPGGREGLLAHWRVDLWCKVNGPSPSEPAVNSPAWVAANDGHLYGCTGWPGCSCPDATAPAGA